MSKTALVLGGGGAKGSYQTGVLEALNDLKIRYDIVTGASVGSINGAIAVTGKIGLSKKLWKTLTVKNILDLDEKSERADLKGVIENGGYSTNNLKRLLNKYIDEDEIRGSRIEYGLVTVKYPEMIPVYKFTEDIEKGRLVDYILGSSAFFPAMRPYEIEGQYYIDGGFSDNLPVNMAIEKGADNIIAVDLKAIGVIKRAKDKNVKITRISPARDLGEILDFNPQRAKINMKLGYLDTLKALSSYEGFYYTFKSKEISDFLKKTKSLKPLKAFSRAYQKAFLKALELSCITETKSSIKPSGRDLYIYILEYLMSLSSLPEFEIYKLKKAHLLIKRSFKQVETEGIYSLKENPSHFIKNISEIIKSIDKKTLIKLIYENLDLIKGDNSIINLLALTAPKELLSAHYLRYLYN